MLATEQNFSSDRGIISAGGKSGWGIIKERVHNHSPGGAFARLGVNNVLLPKVFPRHLGERENMS